jgi:TonB family protein
VIAKQASGASLQDVRHIDLAIHPAATGTQIRQVLQTLYRLGTRQVQLLWRPRRPPPLPAAKDAKLARDLARRWRRFRYRLVDGPMPSDTSGTADNLQELFVARVRRSCPALAQAALSGDRLARPLLERLPTALPRCGCIDERWILSAVYALALAQQVRVAATEHRLGYISTGVILHPDQRWRTQSAKLLKGPRRRVLSLLDQAQAALAAKAEQVARRARAFARKSRVTALLPGCLSVSLALSKEQGFWAQKVEEQLLATCLGKLAAPLLKTARSTKPEPRCTTALADVVTLLRRHGVHHQGVTPETLLEVWVLCHQTGLNRQVIRAFMRAQEPSIKRCYEAQLLNNPGLKANLKLAFTIGSDGRVTTAKVVSTDSGIAAFDGCVLSALKKFRFPKPLGTLPYVTYPYRFRPSHFSLP